MFPGRFLHISMNHPERQNLSLPSPIKSIPMFAGPNINTREKRALSSTYSLAALDERVIFNESIFYGMGENGER